MSDNLKYDLYRRAREGEEGFYVKILTEVVGKHTAREKAEELARDREVDSDIIVGYSGTNLNNESEREAFWRRKVLVEGRNEYDRDDRDYPKTADVFTVEDEGEEITIIGGMFRESGFHPGELTWGRGTNLALHKSSINALISVLEQTKKELS